MVKRLFLLMACCVLTTVIANACDFKFNVDGNRKSCRAGDVLDVTVELTLTHRVCNVAPAQTKFKIDGVKVLSASAWKQVSPTKYVRTVKMEVLADGKKNALLVATRTCDKEGGSGTFSLPKQ